MAFGEGQDTIDPDIETIGMDIVEKCQRSASSYKDNRESLIFQIQNNKS